MNTRGPSWQELRARFAAAGVRLAFVIPVYNHARNVVAVVRAALGSGIPVVVVDDGSTDETVTELAQLSEATVIRHQENRGKGAAILTGLATVARPPIEAHFAVTVDGDGQHDPDHARHLLHGLLGEGAAQSGPCLVVGARVGMDQPLVPWTSRMGRGFSGFWVRAAGGPALGDSQSGFRVYPVAETLALPTRARRFQFEVEVLVQARRAGIPIREVSVPVRYDPPGGRVSHFRPWRDFGRNAATFTRLIVERVLSRSGADRRHHRDAGDDR